MTKVEATELLKDFMKVAGIIAPSCQFIRNNIIDAYLDDPNRTVNFSDDDTSWNAKAVNISPTFDCGD
jgi:hypothetical protein